MFEELPYAISKLCGLISDGAEFAVLVRQTLAANSRRDSRGTGGERLKQLYTHA
jgi:hypothetical protein